MSLLSTFSTLFLPAFPIRQVSVVDPWKLHPDAKADSQHGAFHCLRGKKKCRRQCHIKMDKIEANDRKYDRKRISHVAYVPSTSRCCFSQHQMRDVLLLLHPPLKDRRELIAKVSIGM